MTCIVGFTDRTRGISWIGGDSLAAGGGIKCLVSPPKVFRSETFPAALIGGTTSFRHLDLLRYESGLFDAADYYKGTDIDHKYMVTQFIPKVVKLFKEGIIGEPETDRGGSFIVATPRRVFKIQEDYSVLEPELGFCAVGCGEEVAMGSLLTTMAMDMPPNERIVLSLTAAERYCGGGQRPFHILSTGEDDEIVIP